MILNDSQFYTISDIEKLKQSHCPYCNELAWNQTSRVSLIACNNCDLNMSFNPIWTDPENLVYRLSSIEMPDHDIYYIPQRYLTADVPARWEDVIPAHWACVSDEYVLRLPNSSADRNLAKILQKFKQLILLT